ncbi:glycosyltransferase family 4 protein [Actinomadura rupiterrae]|uniref:glycosyltransferase family 4 protein n=1 Tax=Actinomadura rupiterrae TaxID=559627 RepID=UPI0020A47CBF|nr:glycosyltransferase family 1 protein [Actinomadura rupiterrae]MCP2336626.1 glycosyltransferase involved in cell wall biosynthesis [Actinomadura rupiterrae]
MRVGVSGKALERHVGGSTTYARSLYERLRPMGVQAGMLVPRGARGPVRPLAYAVADGLVWPKRKKFDLLHYPDDTGALVRARVPMVATINGLPPRRPGRPAVWERLWHRRVASTVSVADAVVTVSEFAAHEICARFDVPTTRLYVIPHGVDTRRFHTSSIGDGEVLASLRLPERFVLFLGALAPRRNVPMLAEATARLDVPLVLAGVPCAGDEQVMRAIEPYPNVRILGAVPAGLVAPLLRAASVLALPSEHEGFGMPIVEAMACGTPVLVSDRGALPEVAGGAARVLPELSADALARALAELLDDPSCASELRTLGLARAATFTWDLAARRHLAVFTSLAR